MTNTTTKGASEMNTLKSKIEEAVLGEYDSIWKFCRALENGWSLKENDFTETVNRTAFLLAQAVRDWSSSRQDARKCYEDIMRACADKIKTIDDNQTIFWEVDADRVKEHNAKATAQVEVVRGIAYIIGLEAETVQALFAVATKVAN
jgi:hypothetical protein